MANSTHTANQPRINMFLPGVAIGAGLPFFFNIDFCGALLRLRKALVLAESKKFSGTPAFLNQTQIKQIHVLADL